MEITIMMLEQGIEMYLSTALRGNTDAQYTLGQHNEYRGSKEEANKRFLSAVNQDNPLALQIMLC